MVFQWNRKKIILYYYPFGMRHNGYNDVVTSTNTALNYKYNGKEFEDDLGLNTYDYGARNYDAAIGRWSSIDPLAEKYTNLSPYTYVANMPIVAYDPDGKQIDITLNYKKDDNGNIVRDSDGNATITGIDINITGKVINFSNNKVDMDAAIGDMKLYFENAFSTDADGIKINATFNFSEVDSMEDVEEQDHLIVLAEPGSNNIAKGMVNQIGGKVAFVDADYFTGLFDTTIGTEGEYTTSHELGHLFGLEHYKRSKANKEYLMRAGGGGNVVSSENYNTILKKHSTSGLNIGFNYDVNGLPNMGQYSRSNIFKLTNTKGRKRKVNKANYFGTKK